MRARQMILQAVAVVALGVMCTAQSSMGAQTQSDDQQSANQQKQGAQVQQQNGTKRSEPASMSTKSRDSEVNGAREPGDSRSEADRRIQLRREAIEKLTEAQQTQQ